MGYTPAPAVSWPLPAHMDDATSHCYSLTRLTAKTTITPQALVSSVEPLTVDQPQHLQQQHLFDEDGPLIEEEANVNFDLAVPPDELASDLDCY